MNETTTAPNGDSKNLYVQNIDTKNLQTVFFALEERDIEMDSVPSDVNGTNTIVDPIEIGEIDYQNIGKIGYVGIQVQPSTPELKKAMMQKSEKAIAQRKAEIDKENKDIDDDRNQ